MFIFINRRGSARFIDSLTPPLVRGGVFAFVRRRGGKISLPQSAAQPA